MGLVGGAEEFPASPFPQLCKGLIKYGWCSEQSRAKWDSTNSTSSLGRPVLLRRNPAIAAVNTSAQSDRVPDEQPRSAGIGGDSPPFLDHSGLRTQCVFHAGGFLRSRP